MKNSLITGGSLLGGFLASACCIAPLLASLFSFGGLAFAVALEPYRPLFITITVFLLGAGFYFAYRPVNGEECGPDGECPAPRNRRRQRILLWFITVVTAILIAVPYLMAYLPI